MLRNSNFIGSGWDPDTEFLKKFPVVTLIGSQGWDSLMKRMELMVPYTKGPSWLFLGMGGGGILNSWPGWKNYQSLPSPRRAWLPGVQWECQVIPRCFEKVYSNASHGSFSSSRRGFSRLIPVCEHEHKIFLNQKWPLQGLTVRGRWEHGVHEQRWENIWRSLLLMLKPPGEAWGWGREENKPICWLCPRDTNSSFFFSFLRQAHGLWTVFSIHIKLQCEKEL